MGIWQTVAAAQANWDGTLLPRQSSQAAQPSQAAHADALVHAPAAGTGGSLQRGLVFNGHAAHAAHAAQPILLHPATLQQERRARGVAGGLNSLERRGGRTELTQDSRN